jgi:hypothetical protein
MTTVNYELESLTHDEIHWIAIAINNEIGRMYKQAQSFNESDAWKYKRESEGYIQILLSAKTKLINSIT